MLSDCVAAPPLRSDGYPAAVLLKANSELLHNGVIAHFLMVEWLQETIQILCAF